VRVLYSTTLLASPSLALGRVGPFELTGPSGECIVDEFSFMRADFATLYARGRKPKQFSFKVTALFASEAALLYFLATHEDILPKQADLTLIDDDAAVALVMADAVVNVQVSQVRGVACEVTYNFRGSRFTSEDVPEDLEEDTDRMKVGVANLAEGDESKAIVFDNPFASAPRGIVVTLIKPIGGDGFRVDLEDDITEAGFTVKLGAAVPASGYKLSWTAIL